MTPSRRESRSLGSFAISIVLHGAVGLTLLGVVFRYPLGQVPVMADREASEERVQFVRLPPQPTEGSRTHARPPDPGAAPAALRAPVVTPEAVTVLPVADSSRAAGASGRGLGDAGSGLATGVTPRQPDPRIDLTPNTIISVPRSVAEDVDSIIGLTIGVYLDSMGIAAAKRKAGDWTHKTADGKVWGWDQSGIRLGKFTIPNALLALLPLNAQSPTSPIEQRRAAGIRRDVLENTQRAISEDEFKAAVKRIRERRERERSEKEKAAAEAKPVPLQP